MIDDAVFLLEGAVMLLVDDDEAEFGKGQEQGRARADHHPGPPIGDVAPGSPALGLAQIRMPFNGGRTAACMKAPENLGAEGDLRQYDKGLAAALECPGDV